MSYVTNRARPSELAERLKSFDTKSRSQSPTLADRYVGRIAEQRDAVQKKTFTKWVNYHLQKLDVVIEDMYEDFRDGINLLLLLEVLTDEKLPREKGSMRFHKLQNCQTAIKFLLENGVKVVNIHENEIVDGNSKIILGLIWIIILHFQMSDIKVIGQVEDMTPKAKLLHWCRKVTEGYPQVVILNFTTSWKNGLAFNAILHRYRPDLIDLSTLSSSTPEHNVNNAFIVAEKELGVPRLLDVNDVVSDHPDEKSIMTYVSSLYNKFPRAVTMFESTENEENVLKYEQYCEESKDLIAWIQRVVIQLESRTFPTTIKGMKDIIQDFDNFYTDEFTRMEAKRNHVKEILKELHSFYGAMSSWLEFPHGCHPRDVEVLWLRVLRCIEERGATLRVEMSRVKKVYQIANHITQEAKEMEKTLTELELSVSEAERVWKSLDHDVANERFRNVEVTLKMFQDRLHRIYQNFEHLITAHYQGLEEIRTRIHQIQSRWKVLLERISLFNNHSSLKQFYLKFHAKTELNIDRVTLEKRSKTDSTFIFPIVKKVSKTTLHKQNLPSPESPITKTTVSGVQAFYDEDPKSPNKISKRANELSFVIKRKQDDLTSALYGNGVDEVSRLYKEHLVNEEEIMSWKDEVEAVCEQMNDVELKRCYSELLTQSTARTQHLKRLLTFVDEASRELVWMNEKESMEISRDWSKPCMNVDEINRWRQDLKSEMEMHEIQQRSVIDKAIKMLKIDHPAKQTIETYIASLRRQWTWILEIDKAMELHLLNASIYDEFYTEAEKIRKWIAFKIKELNETSQDDYTEGNLQKTWKKLMELKQEALRQHDKLSSLKLLGKRVVPIKERSKYGASNVSVEAVCNYDETQQHQVKQGEKCTLIDNSQYQKWKVLTSQGKECIVPSVCFVIPAPNLEAEQYMTSLEIQYKHLLMSWKARYSHLYKTISTHQVSSNVKVLELPEKVKFQSLNDSGSEELERLLKELKDCEDVDFEIDSSNNKASQPKFVDESIVKSENITGTFSENSISLPRKDSEHTMNELLLWLEKTQDLLQTKSLTLPSSCEAVSEELREIKELQTERLFNKEPEYESLRDKKWDDPVLREKYERLKKKWITICDHLEEYQKRMDLCHTLFELVNDFQRWLNHVEQILSDQQGLTKNSQSLRGQLKQIKGIQKEIRLRREKIYQIKQASLKLTTSSNDEANDVIMRWERLSSEIQNRAKQLLTAVETLESYQIMYATEELWVKQMEETLVSSDELGRTSEEEFSFDIRKHGKSIEAVVSQGNGYIFDSMRYVDETRDMKNDDVDGAEIDVERKRLQSKVQGC
ncbi:microtubule-actin cross-linking factor 1-like isoform X2 [Xenia sp. Carnegie-2017]|uniref:microtubule-actin cross-linking factor 1-like isoform X2 n=1 Tax=Xenia sp. Carnegie-2017 TaxID=2897299 RepID=UPI001F03481A|nr:microtubule-actin cross-linking factor 1-like isoform X2 [Xenia sp. Carnegie-2017]